MALDKTIRNKWIEIQKRSEVPVNAIGLRIDPKDEATLRVWRDEGIDAHLKGRDEVPLPSFTTAGRSAVTTVVPGPRPARQESGAKRETSAGGPGGSTADLVAALSAFTDEFVTELGDRGFGRGNLLKVAEHRLDRLRGRFTCLEPVKVAGGKIDLSPLERSSTAKELLLAAWRELLAELYRSSVENLGEKTAGAKLGRIPAALGDRHGDVLRQHDLQDLMIKIQWPGR